MYDGKKPLFIFSAPTGGGKTTLIERLLKHNSRLSRVVTYTTRPPRPGEVDGKDYFFVSRDVFESLQSQQDFFIETTIYDQHYYGTPCNGLHDTTTDLIITDWDGANAITHNKALAERYAIVTVWVVPPSLEELKRRLINRSDLSKDIIERRLALCEQELKHEASHRLFAHTLVNDSLDAAYQKACDLIAMYLESSEQKS